MKTAMIQTKLTLTENLLTKPSNLTIGKLCLSNDLQHKMLNLIYNKMFYTQITS